MPPVEGSLAAEANMIVLDTLELIVQIVSITDNFTQVSEGPFHRKFCGYGELNGVIYNCKPYAHMLELVMQIISIANNLKMSLPLFFNIHQTKDYLFTGI